MLRGIDMMRRLEHQYIREQIREMALSPPEALLLRLLDQSAPLRQEDLVAATAIDKGGIARLLARMEEKGLIQRMVSPQCRREKLVSLSGRGAEKAALLRQILKQWDDICYQGFTPEERRMNQAFLERIVKNALDYRQGERENG